jgi:hypothetical protein
VPTFDMAPMIGAFAPESVTWQTYAASTINALGEKVDGAVTETADVVELHPASRRQLAKLHDGAAHAVEPLAVYTTSPVYAGGETAHPTHMIRDADGRRYEVVDVGDYQAQGGVTLVLLSLVGDP